MKTIGSKFYDKDDGYCVLSTQLFIATKKFLWFTDRPKKTYFTLVRLDLSRMPTVTGVTNDFEWDINYPKK